MEYVNSSVQSSRLEIFGVCEQIYLILRPQIKLVIQFNLFVFHREELIKR